MSQSKRFNLYLPISKSTQTEDGDWIIEGPLSDPGEDLQGESMSMAGLKKGLKTFERLGQNLDWEHLYRATKDPKYLIGKGLQMYDAPHPKTGVEVPWLRAKLFKNKAIAKHAIEHLNEGGTLGYSVEGGAIRKGNGIMETVIAMVTVTPQPVVDVNHGTVRLLKSLTALSNASEAEWDSIEVPVVPEIVSLVDDLALSKAIDDMAKSMSVTGAMPHSGPGVSAAEVEDLRGKVSKQEEDTTCPVCERTQSECRCETLRKALAFQLAQDLEALLA